MKKIIKLFIIATITISLFACSDGNTIKTKTIKGEEFLIYNKKQYPLALGTPLLTETEISELNDLNAYERITTLPDCLIYQNQQTFINEYSSILDCIDLLLGDYEDIGILTIYTKGKDAKNLLILKTKDKYYPIDVCDEGKTWLSQYDLERYSFNSVEELKEVFKTDGVSSIDYNSKCPEDYCIGDVPFVTFNGYKHRLYKKHGATVYSSFGTLIPLDLGLPAYTCKEIEEMINQGECEKWAANINTLADAINLIIHLDCEIEVDHPTRNYEGISYPDIGNLWYGDEPLGYSASGLESLYLMYGQCTSSATLMKYLLEGDYPEVGYIHAVYSRGGHAMLYIKGNNDKYYLINPADYYGKSYECFDEQETIVFGWPSFYTDEIACTDTLEELMNEFINVKNQPAENGVTLTGLFTYIYDGVWCCSQQFGPNGEVSDNIPDTAEGLCFVGNGINYITPKHSTSQTNIIGLPATQ